MDVAANTDSGQEACIVKTTNDTLRYHLRLSEDAPRAQRSATARAARVVTEIILGRGTRGHLVELEKLVAELQGFESPAAEPLSAALSGQRGEWLQHIEQKTCSAGECFKPRTVPCQDACPSHIDIPSMLAHIGHGSYQEATRVLIADNPLPYSCGLICPAPCEEQCVRGTLGSSVLIKPLKAVAARCSGEYPLPEREAATGKRIAIVGSGPAGMTAAFYLTLRGHHVEIFEAREQAGGIMRYGIPNYRLPPDVLDLEIAQLRALGVTIHTKTMISNLSVFKEKGFDATFLAIGLQNSKRLGIPGENQPFVLGGMDFLSQVAEGSDPRVGPHVIVIGGGNAAIDVAMTAFRQGATKVQMWYRRTKKDMPANPHEVEMALAEGVELVELWAPVQILPDNRIEFQRSKNAPDAATTANIVVHADQIVAGIGQEAMLDWLDGTQVEIKWGNIVVDPITLATGESGVFAGGDIAHGASTVVAAIGSGKTAAASIHAFVMGKDMLEAQLEPQRRDMVNTIAASAIERTTAERAEVQETDAQMRRTTHDPIFLDLEEDVAKAEVSRCLRCDLCIGCGLCELVCTETGAEALRMIETTAGRLVFEDFLRPADRCTGCGACAQVCPTGAITVEDQSGSRVTTITGTVVRRQPLLHCESCGKPFATVAQYELMRKQLGLDASSTWVCPSCTRKKIADTAMAEIHT